MFMNESDFVMFSAGVTVGLATLSVAIWIVILAYRLKDVDDYLHEEQTVCSCSCSDDGCDDGCGSDRDATTEKQQRAPAATTTSTNLREDRPCDAASTDDDNEAGEECSIPRRERSPPRCGCSCSDDDSSSV